MRFLITVFAIWFLSFGNISGLAAYEFSEWDALLKKHVKTAMIDGVSLNVFSYKNLKRDPGFKKTVDQLKSVSLEDLKTPEERLSFWINAYNVLAAKMVVDNYPVESIKDVGGVFKKVWKLPAGVVAGEERTLDEVEHKILRKMGDPRIHAAIVCASVSCPDIRTEAYVPERLSDQLDDQVKMFLENTEKGLKVDEKKKRILLSAIFKWFEEDFESQGGVVSFVGRYVSPDRKKFLKDFGGELKYLDYNWDLNDS